MKRWVDLQRGRQLKTNHTGINNAFNLIRPNVPGCQFPRVSLKREIPGGQPDLLAGTVIQGWSAMAVRQSLVPSSGAGESRPGLTPDSTSTPEMPLHRGNRHIHLLGWKKWGLETVRSHERRHTCGGANQGVVGILNPGEVGGPGNRVIRGDATKSSLQVLICPLRLAVGLWVVT